VNFLTPLLMHIRGTQPARNELYASYMGLSIEGTCASMSWVSEQMWRNHIHGFPLLFRLIVPKLEATTQAQHSVQFTAGRRTQQAHRNHYIIHMSCYSNFCQSTAWRKRKRKTRNIHTVSRITQICVCSIMPPKAHVSHTVIKSTSVQLCVNCK